MRRTVVSESHFTYLRNRIFLGRYIMRDCLTILSVRSENCSSVAHQNGEVVAAEGSGLMMPCCNTVRGEFKTQRSVLVTSCSSKCSFRNENEMDVAI